MNTDIDTVAVTSPSPDERPWRRRSPLWGRETEIRALVAQGYSLAQVIGRLGLGVSRPYLWRFLRRAAAARPASEPAPIASPSPLAAPGAAESAEAAAEDAAAEALLATTQFSPPTRKVPPR